MFAAKKIMKILMTPIFCLVAVTATQANTEFHSIYFNGDLAYDSDQQALSINAKITDFQGITGLSPGDDIRLSATWRHSGTSFDNGTLQVSGQNSLLLSENSLSLGLFGIQNSNRLVLSGTFSNPAGPLSPYFSSPADIMGYAFLNNGITFTDALLNSDFSAQINGRVVSRDIPLPVPIPAAWFLFGTGMVLLAGIKKQGMRLKGIFVLLIMGIVLILPFNAMASLSPYLDVQNLSSDTGVVLSGDFLSMNATAIALGNPYSAITPTQFSLTAKKNTADNLYSGTLSAGSLLSASFTDLSITGFNFGSSTGYDISAGLTYTGGLLVRNLGSGMFIGFAGSLDHGILISQIYGVTPIPADPVPLPSALVFILSGFFSLVMIKRRIMRSNRTLIFG